MKRLWLVPVLGLVAIGAFVIWRIVTVSGDPGHYYEFRNSREGFEYPTASVIRWVSIVAGELALVSLVIARARKVAHATLVAALGFFVVLLATGIFAMHAPPYFGGFVIAQLFSCAWMLLATPLTAYLGATTRHSRRDA